MLDVDNQIGCWEKEHLGYAVVSLISLFFHFIVIPIYLMFQIRENLITSRVRTHEGSF